MRALLAAAAAASLLGSSAAQAQGGGAQPPTAEKAHLSSNFRLPNPQFTTQSPLQDGMIAQEELAPNAHLGVGLAPMLGRNIHSVRIEQEPVPTRNPGVTLVIKFPR